MSQLVDPFVPVNASVRPRHNAKPVNVHARLSPSPRQTPISKPIAYAQPPAQPPKVQQIQRPMRAHPQSVQQAQLQSTQPIPRATGRQPHRPYKTPPAERQFLAKFPRLRRVLYFLQFPAIIIGCLSAGIIAQSVVIGQILLLVYAVVVLIFRIDSRTTFLMAFLLLCSVISLIIFRGVNAIATNFAVYSFVLLLVGVLSLWRELKERYV